MRVVMVVDPTPAGWWVCISEGDTVVLEQGPFPSAVVAVDVGELWLTLNRAGVPRLIEVRSVPDTGAVVA
ncbi:MAG: hypothetical protein H0X24_04815 [Ktedonobacterales bacterium]|nr:hypothetical protein [Ktedonobacterales bacterium]